MGLKNYPKLKAIFDELTAEKAAIVAKSAPLRAKREELLAQAAPLIAQAAALAAQYKAIERPRLPEIDSELAAIARATGGRSLHQGAAPAPADA